MKTIATIALTALSLFASAANAADVYEDGTYIKSTISMLNDLDKTVTVRGERYRAKQRASMISLKKVSDNLYVVEQNILYYAAIAHNPPLPTKTFRDQATAIIDNETSAFVSILVPAHLELVVSDVHEQPRITCMAYWQGFTYDFASDTCTMKGASGCSSPWEFKSMNACEVGNLLR